MLRTAKENIILQHDITLIHSASANTLMMFLILFIL